MKISVQLKSSTKGFVKMESLISFEMDLKKEII